MGINAKYTNESLEFCQCIFSVSRWNHTMFQYLWMRILAHGVRHTAGLPRVFSRLSLVA
jgi:hypothetical protein